MSWRTGLALLLGFGAGTAGTWIFLARPTVAYSTNLDPVPVFTTLFQAESRPVDSRSCEGNPPTTVGQFMAQYTSSALRPASRAFQDLHCEGAGILQCRLSFGLAKEVEGGARILEFSYDEENRTVVSASLKCLDIP